MTTRTFVAVELDSAYKAALANSVGHLRRALPTARLVDTESLHVTLTFLGDLDQLQLAASIDAAHAAASKSAPFRLSLSELGIFGPLQSPRVIWAGIAGDLAALQGLQADLLHEQAKRDLPADGHRFSPHLTLARPRGQLSLPERDTLQALLSRPINPDLKLDPLRVEHIAVMKSELSRQAARYTRLTICPLRALPPDLPNAVQ